MFKALDRAEYAEKLVWFSTIKLFLLISISEEQSAPL
jgi:hypothetical protein